MKKKIFLLVVMLVALFSVKGVNAKWPFPPIYMTLDEQVSCHSKIFSVKQNKVYDIDCPEGESDILIADAIEGKIDQDELINGTSVRSVWQDIKGATDTDDWLITHGGDILMLDHTFGSLYDSNNISNRVEFKNYIVKKGTLVMAASVTANGNTSQVFYADKDYKVTSFSSGYGSYFKLEAIDTDEPEPNDPEEPTKQEDYKLDLKCLSDKDGSHHCELYYNRVSSESNESNFEVKFKVQAKNVKGQITINDETEELENDKEYTVNGECSDTDCKVLLARFNTKDINKNSSSSMEIVPVSLRIDGEDKPINIENSKCEYSKVIENPKTSTYIILVATIIFAVFAGLLIVLRKKEVLTKV